jgi:hypothetical protein
MSEGTQRGWWQASDGRWYPPSAHPDARQKDEPLQQPMLAVPVVHHSAPYDPLPVNVSPTVDPWTSAMQPPGYPSTPGVSPLPSVEPDRREAASWQGEPGWQATPPEPHPFAGLGYPAIQDTPQAQPPLYPVPDYQSAPLPVMELDQAPPPYGYGHVQDDPTPQWLRPSPRQSVWPWIAIAAAVLLAIPVIWFGATQFAGHDTPNPAAHSEQTIKDGHVSGGDHQLTAHGPIPSPDGAVIYSDDLTAGGGPKWAVELGLHEGTLKHDSRGLTVTTTEQRSLTELQTPYQGTVDQLDVVLTGLIPAGVGDGFGLTCEHSTVNGHVSRHFGIATPSTWSQDRQTQSGNSMTSDGTGGDGPALVGKPTTLRAICATLADGSARFALQINGKTVFDRVDHFDGLTTGTGWSVRTDVNLAKPSHAVTLTKFDVRNLAD